MRKDDDALSVDFSFDLFVIVVHKANVANCSSSFSGESKTIAVHSRIVGDKTGLIDGMNITGIVSLNNVLSIAVPNDAIVNAEGKYYIFLVKKETDDTNVHETDESHDHQEGEVHDHDHDAKNGILFARMEVIKGASQLGYTAITPVGEVPLDTHIAVKGAFFVNAKMSDSGEHAHAH